MGIHDEQGALLNALAEAWRQQQEAECRSRSVRARLGALLEDAQRVGVPAHKVAHAYLRAHAHPASPKALRRALAAIRKRRQRTRSRDAVSREAAASQ